MNKVSSTQLQALILTKDEEPNIERVLSRLSFLDKIIVVDSYSSDRTLEILSLFSNVEIYQRSFDTHAKQWNYGLSLVTSSWVLSLDADYVLPGDFIEETKQHISQDRISAFFAGFEFLVFGRRLKNNNTTLRPVLFKVSQCHYYDDGHTQRLQIEGLTGNYKTLIWHDDRKSLNRWLGNQASYSEKECKMLVNDSNKNVGLNAKIRKTKVLAPFLVFFYCLFVKGLIFKGWAGWHYTLQRTMVEMLLALRLIEESHLKQTMVS